MQKPFPSRVLAVLAHPDDVDFGAAGTISSWTAAGVEVQYAIVTDGDAGGFDTTVDRSRIAGIRREEQRQAAAIVGVEAIEFLGYPDGRVYPDLALRRDIARVIRRFRPERVLCPSPQRDFTRIPASHPDHLAVGEATFCALYPDARNPFAFPELLAEGLQPHSVHEVWVMGHPLPDHYVDITDTLETKLAALRAHQSQLADPDSTMAFVRDWTSRLAERAGFGPARQAEAFFVVNIS